MTTLTDALTAASALLGRRLLTTTWLPALVLLAALATLAGTGAGWSALWLLWEHLPVPAQLCIGLAALALSVILAVLVAGLRMPLIRLFEGYWTALPYGGRLEERYIRSHKRTHEALTERHRRGGFPWPPGYPRTPGRVRPTRMGNVLRAAEEHALLRYDIDSVTAWPRLYTVLPEGFRQEFTAAATSLDRAVIAAVLGAAFAVAGGLTAALSLPWYVVPAVVWAGMAVAWLGYLAAVRAAAVYGDLVPRRLRPVPVEAAG